MHAQLRLTPHSARSAEIIPVEELNRARSLRALARDPGPPAADPSWAYVFPRPAARSGES
ncbi:hypothetical protein [Caulobacter sp. LARHSG274]